ncbi:heme o synthase [Lederbergia wuyishanensis]|uniref:Protoheme IX farnesyltransferase n=1 Tax=Lederbergia wuyishanensis TaxID=1347903 RepID=A0ABU0D484_9BACI|nr:heme o synthase [Lederbergia wuyishanensis]MCJ8008211.1 heme o synthase [Lederbergia wuyishanensis]MDQ0343200.1 protoheme IX farnesyltransferase [Lederbergia wuyishanensis]
MKKNEAPSQIMDKERSISTFISDIKSLFKAGVLIANVLPVFTGFWLALHFSNQSFMDNINLFVLTIIGSTLVMAGALVINNWYDVDIDTIMARTQKRPTVTGHFSLKIVLALGIVLSIVGFILLLFTTIEATVYAFIGWFTYVILYTMWSKRRYTLNTVIGSVSGAVTPLIGWAAIIPGIPLLPLVLFMIIFIWQMPHTFAIAIKKYDEYKAAGVAMLPVVRGLDVTKRQMVVYIACLLPLPFFLVQLGTTFIVIATILNIGWLVVAIKGLFTKDNLKWAHANFLYSVNYLTILFLLMILVTIPY